VLHGNQSKATAGKILHNTSQAKSISLIASPTEGTMTLQISRRGKEYLKTAQTLLHSADAVTDRAVADQLKALAYAYERRAEEASHVDAAKALARAAAEAESKALFEGGRT
jgi:hypothetical protein